MTLHSRHLFLIDGIGAIVTAAFLAGVLAPFESTFGMPRSVLFILAAVAVGLAGYSLTRYIKAPKNWSAYLRMIGIANLVYCVLTLSLLIVYRTEITVLGLAYFVGEIAIVSTLATYELITAHRAFDR